MEAPSWHSAHSSHLTSAWTKLFCLSENLSEPKPCWAACFYTSGNLNKYKVCWSGKTTVLWAQMFVTLPDLMVHGLILLRYAELEFSLRWFNMELDIYFFKKIYYFWKVYALTAWEANKGLVTYRIRQNDRTTCHNTVNMLWHGVQYVCRKDSTDLQWRVLGGSSSRTNGTISPVKYNRVVQLFA